MPTKKFTMKGYSTITKTTLHDLTVQQQMNNATITNTKKRDIYQYHLGLLYSTNNKEMSQRITIPTANATVIIQIPPTTTIKTAERHQPYPPICYDNLHNHKVSPEECICATKLYGNQNKIIIAIEVAANLTIPTPNA